MKRKLNNQNVSAWLLRIGLAAVFSYAAISSLQHPVEWIGFLPKFLVKAVSGTTLVKLFAVYELGLAIWLLSGKLLRYGALLAAITLAAIVLTNPSQLITTFRDVGLMFMALALFFMER